MKVTDDLSLESGGSSSPHHTGNDHAVSTRTTTKEETVSDSDKSMDQGGSFQVGRKETQLVKRSRILLALILILAATGGALATYLFLKNDDEFTVAKEFELSATKVLTVSSLNALHVFDLFKAEALQITTHAISTGAKWPFVTIPFFEAAGDLLINKTKASRFVALHPLVAQDQREAWEKYTADNLSWLQKSYQYHGIAMTEPPTICPNISMVLRDCVPETNKSWTIMAPVWQIAPVPGPNEALINFNSLNFDYFGPMFDTMMKNRKPALSDVINFVTASSNENASSVAEVEPPRSLLCTPVYKSHEDDSAIVAVLTAALPWRDYFVNVLPPGAEGILAVIKSSHEAFTFRIDGPEAYFLGQGDLHDQKYNYLEISNDFAAFDDREGAFGYTVYVYPSDVFYEQYSTNRPIVYTVAIVLVFLFTASVFTLYDMRVENRQRKLLHTATKSSAIVNSLFPETVRDRIMAEAAKEQQVHNKTEMFKGVNARCVSEISAPSYSRPIADLFSDVTVMFADIAGFTAWSSSREPTQVFFLLESIYNSFDKIARKMDVFKVETIGDSYVAVAGLPNPRKDHAEIMARFAYKCLMRVNNLVHNLELTLGPGTSDLRMRFGLHSGPVTAGVLRGEKSRFQLFGDTVNTAARMESTSNPNRIQISQETRDILVAEGKEDWIKARDSKVVAKGKGALQTYWLVLGSQSGSTTCSSNNAENEQDNTEQKQPMRLKHATETAFTSTATSSTSFDQHDPATQRLILWNAENLLVTVQKIMQKRATEHTVKKQNPHKVTLENKVDVAPFDEAKGIIDFSMLRVLDKTEKQILVDNVVVEQLVHLVSTISTMYNQNSFHNFAHASHVTQSVSKLLSRLISCDAMDQEDKHIPFKSGHGTPNEYYSRLASDPLAHFAIVFSALIHDVDHPGVPNATLVGESHNLAEKYKNHSCAEQHSFDLAWNLLMEPTYNELRSCLYRTKEELAHLRQVMVHCVMATDLFDVELADLRRQRWERSFNESSDMKTSAQGQTKSLQQDMLNQKATIVLEYMMQASDVSHTMQHWHIYINWNQKLFQEMYAAFKKGRTEEDPSHGWYEGELEFFDNYVIPLALKLKDCEALGVSGDEYMMYALQNREEWARKGTQIVGEYLERARQE